MNPGRPPRGGGGGEEDIAKEGTGVKYVKVSNGWSIGVVG
jgi:hypothetical protein